MYRHLHSGKTYALRIALRNIRALVLLITMVAFVAIPPVLRIYWYSFSLIGVILLILEFRGGKKHLFRKKPSPVDWLIIGGTNLYLLGLAFLSGGLNSPLLPLLVFPTLTFTMEYGAATGIVNLIPLFLFLPVSQLLKPATSMLIMLNAFYLLFLAAFTLVILTVQNKVVARFNQRIMRLVIHDDLTGLFNRRYLKSKVLAEIRQKNPFSIIMVDINHFKYYNDHWGHPMGDSLLIQIGKVLKKALNGNGITVRTSGDEFIVVLPQSAPDSADQILTRIFNLVEETHFPGEECFPQQKLSLSSGVVSFPEQGTTYERIMRLVDQKLYQNKKARHFNSKPPIN